ncbi:calcium-binding protein, partial [Methylorubrum sp. POS3]|uniref:calcium-binding protein n=1 Tax=Methylorubrum sp. POS3 TaxID=2998492 RepID=UPI00372BCC51
MATYDFRSSIGTTIAFSTSDILSFEYDRASGLNFQQSGSDIIVSISGSSVRLANISFASLKNSNFIFKNGDLVRFDTSASETLSGGTGYDYLDITKGGSDTVSAGDGDDLIVVGSSLNAADRIAGGAGLDTLTLSGTYGSTVVLDSSTITGIENITAGAGSQIRLQIDNNTAASATNGLLSYDASAQSQSDVTIFDGSKVTTSSLVIRTGGGADTLTGGSQADSLSGGDGNDIILGGAGNDSIAGGLGQDTLTGGAGIDTYSFGFGIPRSESAPNTADIIMDFEGRGTAGGDLISLPSFNNNLPLAFNIEALDFNFTGYGSSGSQVGAKAGDGFVDVFWRYNASAARNEIWVDANDDGQFSEVDILIHLPKTSDGATTITFGDFVNNFPVIRLTENADTFTGTATSETIYGVGGADTISGLGGDDQLYGGTGNDRLDGGTGSDQLNGGADNDTLLGGDGTDYLYGGTGADTLSGGNDADVLYAEYDPLTGGGDAIGTVNVLN